MSKFKLIIGIISLFVVQSHLFCFELMTNKQVIDSIFDDFFYKISITLTEKKINNVKVIENSNFNYFTNKLINELSNKKISINENSTTILKLDIRDFEILYNETGDELNRTINISAQIYLMDKNGELSLIDETKTTFKDKINPEDINLAENDMFPFTKGKIPKTNRSFFDQVLEPIIVIGATVLTVVLFFSVRTK